MPHQHCIPNCSTTKTHEDTVKRIQAKTMAQLFFAIWVCWSILRDFSCCSHPIFNFFISLNLSVHYFQCSILNCFMAKTQEDTAKIVHPSPVYYLVPMHSYDSLGARTNFCQGPCETAYIRACYCFASSHAASFNPLSTTKFYVFDFFQTLHTCSNRKFERPLVSGIFDFDPRLPTASKNATYFFVRAATSAKTIILTQIVLFDRFPLI